MLGAQRLFEKLRYRLARQFTPHGLDAILSHANPSGTFEERLRWIASLTRWIGRRTPLPADGSKERSLPGPQTRLRYVLNLLDRNPEWKRRVGRTLRSVLEETDSLELLCEAGIPREPSFLSEALGRLVARALPTNPFASDLGTVLLALFPDTEDAVWLDELDGELLERLLALLRDGIEPGEPAFGMLRLDAREAALVLVGDI